MLCSGIVTSYDPGTMTATIGASDGSGTCYNVSMLLNSWDPVKGNANFVPPSIGAPCLYTVVDGEPVMIGHYAPPNMSDEANPQYNDGFIDRNIAGDDAVRTLPGETVITTPSGGRISFMDMLTEFKMAEDLGFSMNLVNKSIRFDGTNFVLNTPAGMLTIGVNADQTTGIVLSSNASTGENGGTSALTISLGAAGDVFDIKVYGQPLLHVDKERNVVVKAKSMLYEVEQDIVIKAQGSVDMRESGYVKLPG